MFSEDPAWRHPLSLSTLGWNPDLVFTSGKRFSHSEPNCKNTHKDLCNYDKNRDIQLMLRNQHEHFRIVVMTHLYGNYRPLLMRPRIQIETHSQVQDNFRYIDAKRQRPDPVCVKRNNDRITRAYFDTASVTSRPASMRFAMPRIAHYYAWAARFFRMQPAAHEFPAWPMCREELRKLPGFAYPANVVEGVTFTNGEEIEQPHQAAA